METTTLPSAPAQVLWYLLNRQAARHYQHLLLSVAHEIHSALTVSHFSGSRPDAHSIVVKWAFEEWEVLKGLQGLLRLIPESEPAAPSASLEKLRRAVTEAWAYGHQRDNRGAYAEPAG